MRQTHLLPLFRTEFFVSFLSSSRVRAFGGVSSFVNSSIRPKVRAIFSSDRREIRPVCSNLLREARVTPALEARVFCFQLRDKRNSLVLLARVSATSFMSQRRNSFILIIYYQQCAYFKFIDNILVFVC